MSFRPYNRKCAVCGGEDSYFQIDNFFNRGRYSDLDFRSPNYGSSYFLNLVECCVDCGYCSIDVSKANDRTAALVKSQEYKDQIKNMRYNPLADIFLCKALVEIENGNFLGATWSRIYAAWIEDDEEDHLEAFLCRRLAVDTFVQAVKNHTVVTEDVEHDAALLVDLLRRSGQLTKARKVILNNFFKVTSMDVINILNYQMYLIEDKDIKCRSLGEALHGLPKEEVPVRSRAERRRRNRLRRNKIPYFKNYFKKSFFHTYKEERMHLKFMGLPEEETPCLGGGGLGDLIN